jgi:DNA-binding winged helix-turn-helix (wHTH) protein
MSGEIFCFGRCRLIVRERQLLKDDVLVNIGGRAFDLLLALVERAGETIDSRELFARVWPKVIVSPVNLRVHVAGLRRALEDGRDGNRFVISVPGIGYRFVAPVTRLQPSAAPALSRLPAHTLAADYSAVCRVDLASVEDPAHVAKSVATALGCEAEPPDAQSCVIDYLRDKELLLAFDHCEHVFTGVAQLTERLFTGAPMVNILISSRATLHWSRVRTADT